MHSRKELFGHGFRGANESSMKGDFEYGVQPGTEFGELQLYLRSLREKRDLLQMHHLSPEITATSGLLLFSRS